MRRRDFIQGIIGAAAASPFAARAQQSAMPVIGYLGSPSFEAAAGGSLLAFKRGLAETDYVEDRNVSIEYRWADGEYDRLPALALELVHRQVAVIAAPGTPAGLAAKAATNSIPIVFMIPADPVQLGLVANLNHPDSNLTGVAYLNVEIAPKRLELLHEFVPSAKSVGLLINPAMAADAAAQEKELRPAARELGLELQVMNVSNGVEIQEAFATIARDRIGAVQIGVDNLFGRHREQLVALAAHHKVPTIYPWREFTLAGGLMNYGASILDAHRQVGVFTGRILKGAKPGELPVQRPTKLPLVLNLKAAKALGIEFPASLLARADEVIE
jgi:putative ABC transport system substrate-binding protein